MIIKKLILSKYITQSIAILFLLIPQAYAQDLVSTKEVMDKIEETLLFSDLEDITPNKGKEQPNAPLVIKKEYEYEGEEEQAEIEIIVVNPKDSQEIRKKSKMAYSATLVGQYEVAIELYKQVLKKEPNNKDIKFSLAASYHKLKQYGQAKSLYYELLANNPENRQEIIGNLLDVIIEESPRQAVYFLDKLSAQNPKSANILARSAIIYNEMGKKDQAILLLNRAISLEPQNINYRLNLAIIYDEIKEYQKAVTLYKFVIKNHIKNNDSIQTASIVNIKKRMEFINQIKASN